jgi:hypothetical protein
MVVIVQKQKDGLGKMTFQPSFSTIQRKTVVFEAHNNKNWAINKLYCLTIRPKYEQRSLIDKRLNY